MSFRIAALIFPFVHLIVLFLIHLCLSRIFFSGSVLKAFFVSFTVSSISFAASAAMIALHYQAPAADAIALFAGDFIIFLCISFTYIDSLSIGVWSIRIRILDEICNSKNGLTLDQLLQIYNARSIADMRIRRLSLNGQLVEKGGRFYMGGKNRQLLMAKAYLFLRRILFGDSGITK
ncbi:MAG: hypothetical protein FJ088_12405 [Deltaproteobacteria bacterium]|nr:hypothetical protein [Deltaproteobacteria bacterium]